MIASLIICIGLLLGLVPWGGQLRNITYYLCATKGAMLKNIEAVVFDLGGVLLNLDFDRLEKTFTNAGVENFESLFRLGHADSVFKEYESGLLSDEAFVQGIIDLPGSVFTKETAVAAWNSILLDFPVERIRLLESLSAKYRLFLYSNTNAIHYAHFAAVFEKAYNKPLDSLFEKAYYSHKIGYCKPDINGYNFIVSDANLQPGKLLFIDDAQVNVEGAIKAGWNAHWLKPGETVADLEF